MAFAPGDLDAFRGEITGKVIAPGDWGYDDAREAWNQGIDQHPAVIVQPTDAKDVATAVRWAARWSLPVAVQGTGHGGVLPCDGGLLLDTSGQDEIVIDADRATCRVASGAIWNNVQKAAGEHDLAGRAGFNPTVGVLGYTLGGGWGWLSRQHGLACDHIVAADLVLADGSAVRVSAEENPDLFWALKGGGGHLGIVTSLEFGLVPLRSAYGGALTFPLDRAREVLRLFAETTRDADRRLTTAVRLLRTPPEGGLLARIFGGKPIVMVMLCFLGNEDEGERLTRRWTDAGPAHGKLETLEVSEIGSIEGPPPKGAPSVQVGEQLARLDEVTIETLVSRFEPDDAPVFLTELRHSGGAVREGGDAAFDRREGEYLLHVESATPDAEKRKTASEWIDGTRRLIAPALAGSAALGFVGDGDRALHAVPRGFSEEHRARLTSLKARYDPEDRFRYTVGAAFQATQPSGRAMTNRTQRNPSDAWAVDCNIDQAARPQNEMEWPA